MTPTCQCQFAAWPDDFEHRFQADAQIGDCLFWRNAVANGPRAGTKQGGGAPDAILILFDHAGNVNDLSHPYSIARREFLVVESESSPSYEGSGLMRADLRKCWSCGVPGCP